MRDVAVRLAWHYLGTPYTWGGDDAGSFDCSGLVIEILQSVGRFPLGRDATADGLRRMYSRTTQAEAKPGDLVFWLSSGRAIHVAMLIDPPELYIGAEGGGRWATDPAVALHRNAFVKIRPVAGRGLERDRTFANPWSDE